MSKVVQVASPSQLSSLLSSSRVVVVDFYADWCGPCKAVAPIYEELAKKLAKPNVVTFTKVNNDQQQQIVAQYRVTSLPTFVIFKTGKEVQRIEGANPSALSSAIQKLAAEAGSDGGSSSAGGFGDVAGSSGWMGAALPRGYSDVTDQIDIKGLDLLNADSDFGGVRALFETNRPSAAAGAGGKGKGKAAEGDGASRDWVESDTDEQLMLYIPFQSTLKVHTIHLTSFAAPSSDDDDDETPMRPREVQIFTNRAHNLGFEEAEDIPSTQTIELKPEDWDEQTGTARLELRFVKFQNVTSLVLFIVNGEGEGERTRVDRIRVIGESGEKRDMGKLEKIGDEQGE